MSNFATEIVSDLVKTCRKSWFFSLITITIIAILLYLCFMLADMLSATPRRDEGTVVQRVHAPASTSTGVGTMLHADGNFGTVVTVSSNPVKWTVIVSMAGGVVSAEASPERWAQVKEGDAVAVDVWIGRLSGKVWQRRLP